MYSSKRFILIGLMFITTALLFVVTLGTQPTQAQDFGGCPVVVQSAVEMTQQVCAGAGANEACYGHNLVNAIPQAGLGPLSFSKPGDTASVAALRSLQLSPLNPEAGVWGMTRMELRAGVPSSVDENVTVLMFGDVQVENAVGSTTELDVASAITGYINIRLLPLLTAPVIGSLPPGATTKAVGRLDDNSWLRVELPDGSGFGWVSTELISPDGDVSSLAVEQSRSPHYQPMQAFYFASGADDPATRPCASMPSSGLVIQTPEGAGQISFLINEVSIRIGSTVLFEAQPGQQMTITTLEGAAHVDAFGVESTAYAGTQVTVPLDANMHASGPPSPPEPYDLDLLRSVPVEGLGHSIEISPPLTQDQIRERQNADACPGNSCNAPGQTGGNCSGGSCSSSGQNATCPGGSCNAPGQGDCPGNSCGAGQGNNSGSNDNCPGNSCSAPGQNNNNGSNNGADPCPGNSCNAPGQNK